MITFFRIQGHFCVMCEYFENVHLATVSYIFTIFFSSNLIPLSLHPSFDSNNFYRNKFKGTSNPFNTKPICYAIFMCSISFSFFFLPMTMQSDIVIENWFYFRCSNMLPLHIKIYIKDLKAMLCNVVYRNGLSCDFSYGPLRFLHNNVQHVYT